MTTPNKSPTQQLLEGGLPLIAAAVVDLYDANYRSRTMLEWLDRLKASVEPKECGSVECGNCWRCNASIKKPARRYTAPEPLPVGAKVRIVELGLNVRARHVVGDCAVVISDHCNEEQDGAYVYAADSGLGNLDGSGDAVYMFQAPRAGGTWVRTVELVEPAQVAVEGEGGDKDFGANRAEPCGPDGARTGTLSLREAMFERINELEHALTAATRERAEAQGAYLETRKEADSLAAHVRELELAACRGLFGSLAVAIAKRDKSNARAEQMEAVVEAARQYCEHPSGDHLLELQAALDAATASEQAEPSGPPT